MRETGRVIWLMGPTSSGKTTLARALVERLVQREIPASHLDGDDIRGQFGSSLGFKDEDRLRVVSAIVDLANKAAGKGETVVVSALTAYEEARELIRKNIEKLIVVYLDCPIEECAKRDVKGLYAKAKRKEINTLVGYNTPYNPPEHKDIILDTYSLPLEKCVDILWEQLIEGQAIRPLGSQSLL